MATRIRQWIGTLMRHLTGRDPIKYEVANCIITIDQPMSEADVRRFRADFARSHRNVQR